MRFLRLAAVSWAIVTSGIAAPVVSSDLPNLKQFGAIGNGGDDTAAIQAAITAASRANRALYWNSGSYRVSSTLSFYLNSAFVTDCATCVTLTNTNDSAWTLEYNSPVGPASYDLRSGIDIGGMIINAKYGIKVNSQWDVHGGTPAFDNQALILGINIHEITFNGKYVSVWDPATRTYSSPVDPNCGTAVLPSLSELKQLGIGISLSGVFDSEISGFQIQHAGIGIYLDHSDINVIRHGRLALNGRHIHGTGGNAAGTFLGSQNTIENNDILTSLRAGGIGLFGTHYYRLLNNYFEESGTAEPADTFIVTENDQGTVFETNRFDSTAPSAAPMFILNPSFGQQWRNNSWNPGPSTPSITILHDHWSVFFPMQIDWRNNQLDFPVPDDPAVQLSDLNRWRLASNNMPDIGGVLVTAGFPWRKNELGAWVLKSHSGGMAFAAPAAGQSTRTYTFRFVGRAVAGQPSGGYFAISYSEPSSTAALMLAPAGSTLGITGTGSLQPAEKTYTLPSSARGAGSFVVYVDTSTVELASIDVIAAQTGNGSGVAPASNVCPSTPLLPTYP